ncbi:MAG: mycothiol system anti-sigma-R factor [Acidimicrobiia bacterium]|nr:mycothiol system anti-sigma-R factor [Acidimicrobiia bacterium]
MSEEDTMADGDCNDSLEQLYIFLDGELTDSKRASIHHHLEECSPCLERFDFEAELRTVIARRCHDEVPESLRRKVADLLGLPADEA